MTPAALTGLQERLGRAYELADEWGKARGAYEEMLRAARAASDGEAEWRALDRLASMSTDVAFRTEEEAVLKGVRLRANAEEGRGPVGRSGEQGRAEQSGPRFTASQPFAQEALRVARRLGHPQLVARSTFVLGSLAMWACDWAEAAARVEEALQFYAEAGDRSMEAECLGGLCAARAMRGEPREAAELGREAMRMGREIGSAINVAANAQPASLALAEAGEYGEALAANREGLEQARALGHRAIQFTNLWGLEHTLRCMLALGEAREVCSELVSVSVGYGGAEHAKLCAVSALSGDWDVALAHALEADGLWGWSLQPWSGVHYHHETEALLRGGEVRLARHGVRRLGERVGDNRRFRLAYLRASAVLNRWEGDAEGEARHLDGAAALARAIGLPGELWQILADIGALCEGRGERRKAQAAYAEASGVLRGLAARIGDTRLREGFLGASQAQHVLDREAFLGRGTAR